MAIRSLANENFPHKSVLFLKAQGYNVLSIGTDYAGISDAEVMEIAIEEQRLILTFDRDYGELILIRNTDLNKAFFICVCEILSQSIPEN